MLGAGVGEFDADSDALDQMVPHDVVSDAGSNADVNEVRHEVLLVGGDTPADADDDQNLHCLTHKPARNKDCPIVCEARPGTDASLLGHSPVMFAVSVT